ncbi:DUF441 domain-containing protein [Paenibacillus thermotolerans]|uniref:DUF441 domain-containing protein n=1 Tax=Paenibacillus thermotolerans TaxID=3027807 RepID=UPI003CC698BD
MFDIPLLILLAIAAIGVVGRNVTVTAAMLVLALLRVSGFHRAFPPLEKYGITVGVIILTAGVMAPIAGGKIGVQDIVRTFAHWQSLLAIGAGMLVAYLGGRGVSLMSSQPLVVTGLLLGTIIGVAAFRGVPVGPLIAAGILSWIIGTK